MRFTPHALIGLGMALMLYALWSNGAAAMADQMHAGADTAARLLGQNLTPDEVRRIFAIPPQVQDTAVWLDQSLGQRSAAWVERYIAVNILIVGVLGGIQVGWGVWELVRRAPQSGRPT